MDHANYCRVSAMVLPEQAGQEDPLDRIRVHCPMTGEDRSGQDCNGCSRFFSWDVSTTEGLGLMCRIPCSSCSHGAKEVKPVEAAFCEDCLETYDTDVGGES